MMIPYGRQNISSADIQAVVDVLGSDFLTQGPAVPAFEAGVADYCKTKYAIATNSATSALHLACLALGVGFGDIVWTSPITFVASANCALYCGAAVDFVDINPDTFNICPEHLASKFEMAERAGRLPKVLIPVHMCGQPCDMERIRGLADRYGCRIVEDASHALGASYQNGEPIGNCLYSDMVVLSFHPVKMITTGEGGMVLTNDETLARRVRLLRSHGITREPAGMVQEPDGLWYYEQVVLGFNYRMTDIHAALGLSQLGRLDQFVSDRRAVARRYNDLLEHTSIVTPLGHQISESAFHLYVVRIPGKIRRAVFNALRTADIGVNVHYIPVYLQPYYRQLGFIPGLCPNAELYYEEAISLPIFPAFSVDQQDYVVRSLVTAVSGCTS
ncbi:MAG: UDP-4-amino-4,6-dideoxy-N-acetyl-beta-L-altrosamine transaminase [Sterolibacteriaceae bacterium MAG5]|nr:UDP-4-amino-4,6-dideoxy-N-acetyl-beta-L-altrosamine transaminase [Candidatus Nitricoxidireducens bremensis]